MYLWHQTKQVRSDFFNCRDSYILYFRHSCWLAKHHLMIKLCVLFLLPTHLYMEATFVNTLTSSVS